MDTHALIRLSKKLSYLLRHHPEENNLTLDEYGYVSVDQLLSALSISKIMLDNIVEMKTDKKRFQYNSDQTKIKCTHGHSIPVKLEISESQPPSILLHGTSHKTINIIRVEGLKAMNRQYVHLTTDQSVAKTVGSRYGKPIILKINADAMLADGYKFFLTENNVWLTKTVPVQYIVN